METVRAKTIKGYYCTVKQRLQREIILDIIKKSLLWMNCIRGSTE